MTGRGRLSSIELLGEDYDDIIAWAAGELRERTQLQQDILDELNKRLKVRAEEIGDDDFQPISRSAFSRYSVRLAGIARRMTETREISRVLTERLAPGDADTNTIAIAEFLKTVIFEALGNGGVVSPLDLKLAADALKAVTAAQKVSSDRRAKLDREADELAAKAAAKAKSEALEAAETVAREAGLSADRIAQLRRDFLGVRERPVKPTSVPTVTS